jgi:hypothetical protein
MKNYMIWETQVVPHAFVLDELKWNNAKLNLDVELRNGISCKKSFPSDAVFTVDPESPNNVGLADTFYNASRLVLASPKLKEFIESFRPPEVEFLPFSLLNHKSKPAGTYFIIHPIHPVDALDLKASGAVRSKRNPNRIESIKKLVIDENKIDPSRLLFKLNYFYKCVLVRQHLAEAISKQGFTGIRWVECEQYSSL